MTLFLTFSVGLFGAFESLFSGHWQVEFFVTFERDKCSLLRV